MKKLLFKICLFTLAVGLAINFLGILFDPNISNPFGYSYYKYTKEEENTIDILFMGSSFMYCTFSPNEAQKDYGLNSYVVAAPEQPLKKTYENMLEALKTQSPSTLVLEIKSLEFKVANTPSNDNELIKLPDASKESTASIIPKGISSFFKYHSRWKSVNKDSFKGAAKYFTDKNDKDNDKGYVYLSEAGENISLIEAEAFAINDSFETNIKSLNKIVDLCEKNHISLVFLIAPSANKNYFNNYLAEVQLRYPAIPVLNLNNHIEEIGLDFKTDMYDGGHPNYNGAVKCTRFISEYLYEKGYAKGVQKR